MLLLPMAEATTFGFAAQIIATISWQHCCYGRADGAISLGAQYFWVYAGVLIALQPGGQAIRVNLWGATVIALLGATATDSLRHHSNPANDANRSGRSYRILVFSLTSTDSSGHRAVMLFGEKSRTLTEAWLASLQASASSGAGGTDIF